jgi:hypothetical protein
MRPTVPRLAAPSPEPEPNDAPGRNGQVPHAQPFLHQEPAATDLDDLDELDEVPDEEGDEDRSPGRKKKSSALLVILGVVLAVVLLGGAVLALVLTLDSFTASTPVTKTMPKTELASERGVDRVLPPPPPRPEATQEIDLPFCTPDFNMAVVIQPKRILKSPLLGAFGLEALLAALPRDQTADLEDPELIVLYMEPWLNGQLQQLPVGGVVRFTRPVQDNASLQALLAQAEKVEIEGKTCYRKAVEGTNVPQTYLHVSDDRTVVSGTEETLKKMFTAGQARGPLADRLKKVRPDDDLTLVFVLEPYQKLLGFALWQIRDSDLPPQVAALKNLLPRVVSLSLSLNLSDQTLLWAGVEMADEGSAGELLQMARTAHDQAKRDYPARRASLGASGPYAWVAVALGDQVADGLTLNQDGRQVTLTVRRPERFQPDNLPAKDLIAASGFNDAAGLWADKVPHSPFRIDGPGDGGVGEPGWQGLWPRRPNTRIQNDVVYEGDGALYLGGPEGTERRLGIPETGTFVVEQYVRLPRDGGLKGFLKNMEGNTSPADAAVTWRAAEGTFWVLDGDEQGGGKLLDTGLALEPDRWHKVTLRVDVAAGRWEFSVDDQKFDRKLGFRTRQPSLNGLHYLGEAPAGAYLDAVQLKRIGPPGPAMAPMPPRPVVPPPPER